MLLGACICIPTDTAVLSPSELELFINRENVSALILTPSVARRISPQSIPSVRQVALTGEAIPEDLKQIWLTKEKLTNCYGPAECTIFASVSHIQDPSASPRKLESGLACILWVVENHNVELLTPPGMTGELLIEGPLVGTGYLQTSLNTESGFSQCPRWLARFKGREVAVYRTGDQVQVGFNGSMHFIGRKDLQVKVNGQRLELLDVESHVKALAPNLDCVVECVPDSTSPDRSLLVAFFSRASDASSTPHSIAELQMQSHDAEESYNFSETVKWIRTSLTSLLPSFMIPQLFVPLTALPLLPSGKRGCETLRLFNAGAFRDVHSRDAPKTPPHGPCEGLVQEIWSKVLHVDKAMLGREDDFLRLGGDSIRAMHLASVPEYAECGINVPDILTNPTIWQHGKMMHERLAQKQPAHYTYPQGTSGPHVADQSHSTGLYDIAANILDIIPSEIENIYPCTPMQSGLIALSSRSPDAYWTILKLKQLLADRDIERFRNTWASVETLVPILRTRIILVKQDEPVQVVLRTGSPIQVSHMSAEPLQPSSLGQECLTDGAPLLYCLLIRNGPFWIFQLTMHHSLYDGWFINLLSDLVGGIFQGKLPAPVTPFRDFVKATTSCASPQCRRFWQTHLRRTKRLLLPPRPAHDLVETDNECCSLVKLPPLASSLSHSAVTIVRAAWAMLLCCLNGSDEALLGEVLNGRTSMSGLTSRTAGPTVTTVPVRVPVCFKETTADLFGVVKKHYLELIPFQQTGLLEIARMLPESDNHAVNFSTLLLVDVMD